VCVCVCVMYLRVCECGSERMLGRMCWVSVCMSGCCMYVCYVCARVCVCLCVCLHGFDNCTKINLSVYRNALYIFHKVFH
jgi:hypothetical protein